MWLHKNKNCSFSSWTGELPSGGSYFVVCLCFCPLYKLSFNTRSMKSGFMELVWLGRKIGNYGQSKIMAPSKSIPDSLLRLSWSSKSLDRQATNCHEWRSAQCQAACLEREPEFRPPDDQQDLNNLWKRGVVCICSNPLPTSVGSESGPATRRSFFWVCYQLQDHVAENTCPLAV